MTVFISVLSLLACNTSGAVVLDEDGLSENTDDTGENTDDTGDTDDTGEVIDEPDPIDYAGMVWGYVPEWDDWVFCEGELELTVESDGRFVAETECDMGRDELPVILDGQVKDGEVEGEGIVVISGRDAREEQGDLGGEANEREMVMAFEVELRFRGGGGESYEADAVFYMELGAE